MSNKKKISLTLKNETIKQLKDLKGNLTYNEVVEFLLSMTEFRGSLKGLTRAEIQVKKWLAFGHSEKITTSQVRKWANVDLATAKKVFADYENEITEFNKQTF